jgi:hypothetical protein
MIKPMIVDIDLLEKRLIYLNGVASQFPETYRFDRYNIGDSLEEYRKIATTYRHIAVLKEIIKSAQSIPTKYQSPYTSTNDEKK